MRIDNDFRLHGASSRWYFNMPVTPSGNHSASWPEMRRKARHHILCISRALFYREAGIDFLDMYEDIMTPA